MISRKNMSCRKMLKFLQWTWEGHSCDKKKDFWGTWVEHFRDMRGTWVRHEWDMSGTWKGHERDIPCKFQWYIWVHLRIGLPIARRWQWHPDKVWSEHHRVQDYQEQLHVVLDSDPNHNRLHHSHDHIYISLEKQKKIS